MYNIVISIFLTLVCIQVTIFAFNMPVLNLCQSKRLLFWFHCFLFFFFVYCMFLLLLLFLSTSSITLTAVISI